MKSHLSLDISPYTRTSFTYNPDLKYNNFYVIYCWIIQVLYSEMYNMEYKKDITGPKRNWDSLANVGLYSNTLHGYKDRMRHWDK